MYVLDVKPDPKNPKIVKVIEPEELAEKTGYSRPHTIHCGPDGIYVSALGNPDGDGPGGIFLMDHETFDLRGRWEIERGSQELAYDFWWHLGQDVVMTSEWGTPKMVENGVVPELLLSNKYGHKIHFFDLHKRKHIQEVDIGPEHQMALELRPAHDPTKSHGFMGVVVSTANLAGSIWTWYKDGDKWAAKKIIEIPPEPAKADDLPDLLKGFEAVPPLITDIDLSMDDRFLYVSCWGTGEFHQYDVSDPLNPKLTGKVRLGGIVSRAAHPAKPDQPLNGAPQMVEISKDGKRVLLHQLTLWCMGCAVLSRRHRWLDGEDRRRHRKRRHDLGREVLPGMARRSPPPPDPARRRRLLLRQLLLPLTAGRSARTCLVWLGSLVNSCHAM